MYRAVIVFCALAGCYNPTPPLGAPCDSGVDCPSTQGCVIGLCSATDAASGSNGEVWRDNFDNGLQGWQVGGAWTTGPGVIKVDETNGIAGLSRALPGAGPFLVTLSFQFDAINDTNGRLPSVGVAVVEEADRADGVACELALRGNDPVITLMDLATDSDPSTSDFSWMTNERYTLVLRTTSAAQCDASGVQKTARANLQVRGIETPVVQIQVMDASATFDEIVVEQVR